MWVGVKQGSHKMILQRVCFSQHEITWTTSKRKEFRHRQPSFPLWQLGSQQAPEDPYNPKFWEEVDKIEGQTA